MTFVDTSVLLDIGEPGQPWGNWSRERLNERAAIGPLLINDIVYAEFSLSFIEPEALDRFFAAGGIKVERTPPPALFAAARAHLEYRRRGGHRPGVLPDFFIGAHAAVRGVPLLTRDAGRVRTYFPAVDLISP